MRHGAVWVKRAGAWPASSGHLRTAELQNGVLEDGLGRSLGPPFEREVDPPEDLEKSLEVGPCEAAYLVAELSGFERRRARQLRRFRSSSACAESRFELDELSRGPGEHSKQPQPAVLRIVHALERLQRRARVPPPDRADQLPDRRGPQPNDALGDRCFGDLLAGTHEQADALDRVRDG